MTEQIQPPAFTPAWLAPADVKAWLALHGQDPGDDKLVTDCSAATEPYVQRCRPEWWRDATDPEQEQVYGPDAETYHGAVMYAARQVRRRNSPAGVQSFGDAGVSFVSRYDADIERALRTGAWTRPGVG